MRTTQQQTDTLIPATLPALWPLAQLKSLGFEQTDTRLTLLPEWHQSDTFLNTLSHAGKINIQPHVEHWLSQLDLPNQTARKYPTHSLSPRERARVRAINAFPHGNIPAQAQTLQHTLKHLFTASESKITKLKQNNG